MHIVTILPRYRVLSLGFHLFRHCITDNAKYTVRPRKNLEYKI
jgi:hypothetical protein